MKKYFLILCCFFSFCISFGQLSDGKTETHAKDNYSIEYPKNWELNTSGEMGSTFFLFSELSSEEDRFKENVNLMIQNLTGHNINMDQYVEISTGQITTMISEGTILESERKMENGIEFHQVIFTGKQGPFSLKFEQRYWIKDNTAYVLTFTSEKEQFAAYSTTSSDILNSFKIK